MTVMAGHGGVLPFGVTFLSLSDYMRQSIRLAPLSRVHVIYIWTHETAQALLHRGEGVISQ